MLMCTASRTSSPWHNFVSDTDRWVVMNGPGTSWSTLSTPCLNNGGIYPLTSDYLIIATLVSNGAKNIFTTTEIGTFLGTPLPSKQI